jgi:hypothetical protein
MAVLLLRKVDFLDSPTLENYRPKVIQRLEKVY